MAKQQAVRRVEIAVEVYMADKNPPTLFDFFVNRSGRLTRAPVDDAVGGLIQVVLAGPSPPTNRQLITVKRQFGFDERLKLLKFY